jgi:hypothetical protein
VVFVGVLYLGYRESPIMAQQSGYDQFPPMANDCGTKHPVPDPPPRNSAQTCLGPWQPCPKASSTEKAPSELGH